MDCEKIIVAEDTNLKTILDFMGISLEEFYYDYIADNINRADYWRKFKDDSFEIIKK